MNKRNPQFIHFEVLDRSDVDFLKGLFSSVIKTNFVRRTEREGESLTYLS